MYITLIIQARRIREGDRIVMRPTWPEGRLVTETGHGVLDHQIRVTFDSDEECHAFYDSADQLEIRRPD